MKLQRTHIDNSRILLYRNYNPLQKFVKNNNNSYPDFNFENPTSESR